MLRAPVVALPVPEPVALLDATLLFVVQLLIARHPDLLAPPEEPAPRPPALRAARRLLDAVRDLHGALDAYRALLPRGDDGLVADPGRDDFPF